MNARSKLFLGLALLFSATASELSSEDSIGVKLISEVATAKWNREEEPSTAGKDSTYTTRIDFNSDGTNGEFVEPKDLPIGDDSSVTLADRTNIETPEAREEKSSDGLFKYWSTSNKKRDNTAYTIVDDKMVVGHLVTVQPQNSSDFEVNHGKVGDLDLDLNDTEVESKLLEIDEQYVMEASEYGLSRMKQLYEVDEPKLYDMGLWLEPDNPARFVATFNWQSAEARKLAQYGYASLQASTHLRQKLNDELESRVDGRKPPKLSSAKRSTLRQQCPLRGVPRCPPASKRYRTHDGTCNNRRRGRWGSALTPVERFLPPHYEDDVSRARGDRGDLPSPRFISSRIHTGRRKDAPEVSHLLMQWGQFLDHDITSSSQARAFNGSIPRCCLDRGRHFVPPDFMHPECMPIEVPVDDEFYGPLGIRCLEFVRSSPAPRVDCEFGWREQMNQVTAYIDASPIYSSSARQADKLRIFRNGLLQYGRAQARRPLLPPREDDEEALCQGGAVDASCFKAGDGRVNEHPGLVAMHIIWLRKHNRIATELAHLNPHWSDEKIYQETRKIIGAFIQHITYKEFLPIVLGNEVMELFDLNLNKKGYYDGYSSKVNPSPANAFGAAAFRFGHSLVQDSFMRYDRFHRPLPNNVSLHEELSNPSNIWSFGAVDRLVLGMCNQPSQKRDEFISPELTNHLFQTSRFGFGMDLASINIQRGRDHGLPSYVEWRVPCGLTPINAWDDLFDIMPVGTVRNLQDVYRRVDDIDLFTGGMAERPVVGGLVGPTFACIIAQQFSNLRKGDRFWYENGGFESSFTPAQLQQIRRVSLAQILCQTLENIDTIQPFVFMTMDDFHNERLPCNSRILNNFDLTPWTEREFDFNNNVNDFDRTNFIKSTSLNPNSTQAFTPSPLFNDKLTNDVNVIDDKLDLPDKQTTSTEKVLNNHADNNKKESVVNLQKNKTEVKLDDKLDFFRNNILDKRHVNTTNETQDLEMRSFTNKDDTSLNIKITNNVPNLNSSLKTYGFLFGEESPIPFFSNLFSDKKTTTPIPYVRPNPQFDLQQSTSTPEKFTYLINIVPKTTPKYDSTHKEIIKITVQGSSSPSKIKPQYSSFPYDKRPVYENNHLQYRPINSDQNNVYYNQNDDEQNFHSYNKPSNLNQNYGQHSNDHFSQENNKPYRPYRPMTNYDYTTESNPYNLVTFTHLDSYPNSFSNYPESTQNFQGSYMNNRKPTLSTNVNNYRPTIHNSKPTKTGITIYIENNPASSKPLSDNPYISNNGHQITSPRPTYQNSYSNSDENIPLFTRPNYQKPLLNRPITNIRPNHDIGRPIYTQQQSNYVPLESEYGQFSRPSDNNYEKNPPNKINPTNVNINLASQSGAHHPSDISIVIDPNVKNKIKVQTANNHQSLYKSISTERPTIKYFYIGNVLHKYDEQNSESKIAANVSQIVKAVDRIVKENYNNIWKPNKEEHKLYDDPENSEESDDEETINETTLLSLFSSLRQFPEDKKKIGLLNKPSSSNRNKNKGQVFFDVIPSENRPAAWMLYNERPEEKIPNNPYDTMPKINIDPLATKELPRPINLH